MSSYQYSEEDLHKLRRSLLRKKTRAGWGAGISGVMCAGGLSYMAVSSGIALYGYKKPEDRLKRLEQQMMERGIKPRSQDELVSFLTGTAEKLAVSTILLGHGEICFLDGQLGFGGHLTEVGQEIATVGPTAGTIETPIFGAATTVVEAGPLGMLNDTVNGPVDAAKVLVSYADGGSVDLRVMTVVGGTAAAVEYATNRVGFIGREAQNVYQTGEGQHAMVQKLGLNRS